MDAVAYTGVQAVDLRRGEPSGPGLRLWVVDHRYYEVACACGHRTRAQAGRGVDPLLAGVELSIGTIHQTIHEAGAAVAPAEDELVEAVLESPLLHADEPSWPERGQGLWLWVFTAAVILYQVARRGKELCWRGFRAG